MIVLRFFGIGIFFSVLVASAAASASDVRVYRPDGSLQCGRGEVRSLEDDKLLLEKLGAQVTSAEKRSLPIPISKMCGAPTGRVNTFVIGESDWEKIRRGFVGPANFGLWIFDAKSVAVYEYDGTLLCENGREITLDQMAKQLTQGGVSVISQRKGSDGLLHIQLCGSTTGKINIFEIPSSDLQRALDLGFSYLVTADTARSIVGESQGGRAVPAVAIDAGPYVPWPFPW